MDAESNSHLTLGDFLKQAREKKNWTVEQIAEQLKLKLSTVKALEANQYHDIGSMVYIKGYLRSYAKLLNVNIDNALAEIEGGHESHAPVAVETQTMNQKAPLITKLPRFHFKKDRASLWACGIILILLVILAFAWHHHRVHAKMAQAQVAAVLSPPPNAKEIELPKISISTKSDDGAPPNDKNTPEE